MRSLARTAGILALTDIAETVNIHTLPLLRKSHSLREFCIFVRRSPVSGTDIDEIVLACSALFEELYFLPLSTHSRVKSALPLKSLMDLRDDRLRALLPMRR